MLALLLISSILLPVFGGCSILFLHLKDDAKRELLAEAVAIAASVLVWALIFMSGVFTGGLSAGAPAGEITVFSFASGFSVSFAADGMSMLFAGMISLMWPLVLLYAFAYMRRESRKNMFFGFFVMTYGITLGVAFSANLLTLYVFFEMLTLVTIPLVAHYGNHESLFAARKYAAYTIGGAALAFFAVVLTGLHGAGSSFIYGGSLSGEISLHLLRVAFLLGFFGFGTKAAVFPFYDWLPTASAAPTPVTALLHAVAVVNSGAFAVMRLTYYVVGPDILYGTRTHRACLVAAAFSLVFAGAMAVRERHFKRKLAFSTMSNLSYMLLGAMMMSSAGFKGGLMHMLFHGIIKMSLFLCAGAFMHETGKSYVYEIDGAGRKMPVTFTCYTLGALSLIGIPGFCGFLSKWQLLTAGAEEGTMYGVLGCAALITAAFLCAIYSLTVTVRAFFPVRGKDLYAGTNLKEASREMLIPIVFFTAANVALGIWGGPVTDFIGQIAGGMI